MSTIIAAQQRGASRARPPDPGAATMKAVLCQKFGPPESLEIVEIDDPTPGPQEIVVDVRAAAITFPDALMIEDKYQFKPQPPFIPGGDVAGVVRAVGAGVDGFKVGDR